MKNVSILVTDDVLTNRILLTEVIKELGYNCYEAEDGKQAIEIIKNEEIDIVFMDIEMPVMNGIETVAFIRNKLEYPKNKVPVIVLTAHDPKMFFEDYSDVGFTFLLTKPYSTSKIGDVIHKYTKK